MQERGLQGDPSRPINPEQTELQDLRIQRRGKRIGLAVSSGVVLVSLGGLAYQQNPGPDTLLAIPIALGAMGAGKYLAEAGEIRKKIKTIYQRDRE
jgi:hypothetical protein